MAHELVWRVRDRAALERRFQLMFARSERRDWAAARLVEKFIEDIDWQSVLSQTPPFRSLAFRRTVANWCGSGRITAVKLGDDWRVPRAEVQRLARGGG